MAETYLRQSALAARHLPGRAASGLGAAGVGLSERPHRALIDLRGNAEDPAFIKSVAAVAGLTPPVDPNTAARRDDFALIWLGPDQWWLAGPIDGEGDLAARLREALAGQSAAIT